MSSLRRRPMRRVIDPLRQMGARIRSRDGDRAPLEIRGGQLQRDRLHAAGAERAGEIGDSAGGTFRGGRDDRARVGAHARSHRSGAARIRRDGRRREGRDSHRSAAEIDGAATGCAGGPFVRGVSDWRGAGTAGIVADAAQRGAESYARARARFPDFDRGADHAGVGAVAQRRISGRCLRAAMRRSKAAVFAARRWRR